MCNGKSFKWATNRSSDRKYIIQFCRSLLRIVISLSGVTYGGPDLLRFGDELLMTTPY